MSNMLFFIFFAKIFGRLVLISILKNYASQKKFRHNSASPKSVGCMGKAKVDLDPFVDLEQQ